jgi:hypothetical protein
MTEETQTTAEEIVETPEEIVETPATIEEETVPDSVPEEIAENPPEPQTLLEPKRKPGRPAGSRNREPAKPRAKKKVPVVVSEAVDIEPPPPTTPTETPRWDAQHQPIPTETKTEIAELMLRLLSQQSSERIRRKDNLRRSWFA